jgi:hypothetical protein
MSHEGSHIHGGHSGQHYSGAYNHRESGMQHHGVNNSHHEGGAQHHQNINYNHREMGMQHHENIAYNQRVEHRQHMLNEHAYMPIAHPSRHEINQLHGFYNGALGHINRLRYPMPFPVGIFQAFPRPMPFGMQCGMPFGMQSGMPFGMQNCMPFGFQFGMECGNPFGSQFGMQCGMPFGLQSGMPFGMQSGMPFGMQGMTDPSYMFMAQNIDPSIMHYVMAQRQQTTMMLMMLMMMQQQMQMQQLLSALLQQQNSSNGGNYSQQGGSYNNQGGNSSSAAHSGKFVDYSGSEPVKGVPHGRGEIEQAFGPPGTGQVTVQMPAGPGGKMISVTCHHKIADKMKAAFEEIQERGLSGCIHSFDGAFCDRNKRGGSSKSVHSWGIAFDVNASQNPMGSSKETSDQAQIAQIFAKHGFHQLPNDPMHFQYATGY